MMRKSGCMLVVTVITALGMAGCSTNTGILMTYPHATSANMSQTSLEHYQSVADVVARDRRALIDDLDMFFMTDRPTRLTRWTTE